MKAIVLWEPWATLMALGLKRVETRSWPTRHRGPLAVCAARREPDWRWIEANDAYLQVFGVSLLGSRAWFRPGCVLAVGELYDCWNTLNTWNKAQPLPEAERRLGDLGPGRFGWLTRGLRRLPEPVPCRGRQGLFELPAEVEAAVLAQLTK